MFWASVRGPTAGICDEDLLGKEFREGKAVLSLSENYFGGERINEKELIKILEEKEAVWLVGRKCISVAVDHGFAEWKYVKYVQGVPHINVYRIGL